MSAYTYTKRSCESGQSQASSQKYAKPGFHYEPWQPARTDDGRDVWIVRQNGDGENAFYYTDDNEQLTAEQVSFI